MLLLCLQSLKNNLKLLPCTFQSPGEACVWMSLASTPTEITSVLHYCHSASLCLDTLYTVHAALCALSFVLCTTANVHFIEE